MSDGRSSGRDGGGSGDGGGAAGSDSGAGSDPGGGADGDRDRGRSGERPASGSTWLRGGRGILAWVGGAYLALLPLGAFFILPVGDTHATGADLFLLGLLVVGAATWVRSPGFRGTVARSMGAGTHLLRRGGTGSPGPGAGIAGAVLLLGVYGIWATASGAWGYHAPYSVAKGVGYLALTGGVAAIVWSGLEWDRALDAWLLGTLGTVTISLALAGVAMLAGSGGGETAGGILSWTHRVLYEGGSLAGLPGRRLRGPFLHPNGMGDYLVVSGALLWARWPAFHRSGPEAPLPRVPSWLLWAGTSLYAVALGLTLSSAWVAAGILLLLWGRRKGTLLLRAVGGLVAATVFAALVFPLRIGFGRFQVITSGIRPTIWEDAVRAFFTSPLMGVGAAPVLADAVDPVDPESGLQLWDAHNAYLSVLGQFGLVGFLLVAGAVFLVVRSLVRARRRGSAVVTRGGREAREDNDGRKDKDGREGRNPPEGRDGGEGREDEGGREPVAGGPLLLDRARRGVLGALLAVGVHGLVIAGEDFRHWWALVALAGLAVGGAWDSEPWAPTREGTS